MTLNKARGRMFKSVGWTWNPCVGCTHRCTYCWARRRYRGNFEHPMLRPTYLNDNFPGDGTWIFVCSMGDLFCEGMPADHIYRVIAKIIQDGDGNTFLLQTKNPERIHRMRHLLKVIPDRFVVGTTLETNWETPWSDAPYPGERAYQMQLLSEEGLTTFLSLEPIADFDHDSMLDLIEDVHPVAIEIGLENYTSHLPKPSPEKLNQLIEILEDTDITLHLKDGVKEYIDG